MRKPPFWSRAISCHEQSFFFSLLECPLREEGPPKVRERNATCHRRSFQIASCCSSFRAPRSPTLHPFLFSVWCFAPQVVFFWLVERFPRCHYFSLKCFGRDRTEENFWYWGERTERGRNEDFEVSRKARTDQTNKKRRKKERKDEVISWPLNS